jgi:hypothetical protein
MVRSGSSAGRTRDSLRSGVTGRSPGAPEGKPDPGLAAGRGEGKNDWISDSKKNFFVFIKISGFFKNSIPPDFFFKNQCRV